MPSKNPGPRRKIKNIMSIDPAVRCYKGASVRGQLLFGGKEEAWVVMSGKSSTRIFLDHSAIVAMGITECCIELGRGKVLWFPRGGRGMRTATTLWTPTTYEAPNLVYTDFVWDDDSRDEWFGSPHWARLDMLNARAQGLNLNVPTMPITLNFETNNYANIRFNPTSAAVVVTFNSSGYTYLGFTMDMAAHMTYVKGHRSKSGFWLGDKASVTQFKMWSGQQVATRLQEMWSEAREESLWLWGAVIDELVKGHNEWAANGGYTIASEPALGPELARAYEQAVKKLEDTGTEVDRLSELRLFTGLWNREKQVILQNYIDTANTADAPSIMEFLCFNKDWLTLSEEEKRMALELWKLEDESDRREAVAEAQNAINIQNTANALAARNDPVADHAEATGNARNVQKDNASNVEATADEVDLPVASDMLEEQDAYREDGTYKPTSFPYLVDQAWTNLTPDDMNSYSWGWVYNVAYHYSNISTQDREEHQSRQVLQRILGPLEVPGQAVRTRHSLLSYIQARQEETRVFELDSGRPGGWIE